MEREEITRWLETNKAPLPLLGLIIALYMNASDLKKLVDFGLLFADQEDKNGLKRLHFFDGSSVPNFNKSLPLNVSEARLLFNAIACQLNQYSNRRSAVKMRKTKAKTQIASIA